MPTLCWRKTSPNSCDIGISPVSTTLSKACDMEKPALRAFDIADIASTSCESNLILRLSLRNAAYRPGMENARIPAAMPSASPAAVETTLVKLKRGMKKRKNAASAPASPRRASFAGGMKRNVSSRARLASAPMLFAYASAPSLSARAASHAKAPNATPADAMASAYMADVSVKRGLPSAQGGCRAQSRDRRSRRRDEALST